MGDPYQTAAMLREKHKAPQQGSPHVLYTPADFTPEEYERRNRLAVAVIDGGLHVCKWCGAAESELKDWPNCAKFRTK